MKVLKFGGTSVGSPERIRGVKKIIESQNTPCLVVVSAFQGITDDLKQLSELASVRDDEYENLLNKIIAKHIEFTKQLVPVSIQKAVIDNIKNISDDLRETLNGIYLLRELSKHSLDQTIGTGEILSSMILSYVVDNSQLIDSRNFIKTDSNFGFANVDFEKTDILISKGLIGTRKCIIAPGFIASNSKGETTTLGRGGSDYSASIFAAALNA